MKILTPESSIISLQMENGETNVTMVADRNVEIIIVLDGAKGIQNEAFRLCPKLRELHLPKSINFIGDKIFQIKYSEVKIYYEGSSEDFKKIDFEREEYIPGPYDKYPYYSDFGASCDYKRFYRLYDNYEMWCEVYCKEDEVTLTYGSKTNHI